MPNPIASIAALNAAVASKVEEQVRKDAAGLDPQKIEEIVALVLRYGPSFYSAILTLFHVIPKS